jgi:nucleotide-binding universal stress UspA family protein
MGTHGRSALTHLLLGSVASDVSRSAGIPVTLVK